MFKTDKGLKKQLQIFSIIISCGIALLFGIYFPWLMEYSAPRWPWLVALVFLLIGRFSPMILAPVFSLWMKLGYALGWFNTRLILALIYFVFMFPLAMMMKLFSRDALKMKMSKSVKSYRINSQVYDVKKDMEKPY